MALKAGKISTAAADNFRLMKGKYVTSADGDGDYIAFELPKKCMVLQTVVDIKTAFSGTSTGTLTVGIKEPGAAIVADALAVDGTCLPEATGMKTISQCKYLENGGVLTLGVTKGDSSTDLVARAFVVYSVIH